MAASWKVMYELVSKGYLDCTSVFAKQGKICTLPGQSSVTWNLLISASGAPVRENFKSDRILHIPSICFCLVDVQGTFSPQDSNIMTSVSTQLSLVLMSLLLVLPVVEAVEAGDAIALLLGVILSITGICACLGVYARKRNGQM
ncbi:Small integral membrane protein 30 [Plecturocebus cupreus]